MSELSHQKADWLIQRRHLSTDEREALTDHLGRCAICRDYASTHIYLSRHLHVDPVRTSPTPELTAAVVRRVRNRHRRSKIMNPIRTLAVATAVVALVLVAWLLLRPAPKQSVAAPPPAATEAPTRTPWPTLTPLPTRSPAIVSDVTTSEALAGIWGFRDGADFCCLFQFNDDGTFSHAGTFSRERLEDTPGVRGDFWFEDTSLHLLVTENNNTALTNCYDDVGVYDVALLENDLLRFQLIEDNCGWRRRLLSNNDFESVELEE